MEKMQRFDVLSSKLNCFQSHFLESSAGTGKTFSIENIVGRLLIEKEPLELQEILLVTFTKAATKDLKIRIYSHLCKLLDILEGINREESIPEYLLELMKENKTKQAITRIQIALSCFEEAQIFTIHAFCARMLKEYFVFAGLPVSVLNPDDCSYLVKDEQLVKDFLLHLLPELCSTAQLQLILKQYSIEKLIKIIASYMQRAQKTEKYANFSQSYRAFCACVDSLKKNRLVDGSKLLEAFKTIAPFYTEICSRQGNVKEEILDHIEHFIQLFEKDKITYEDFDQLIEVGLPIVELLLDNKLKKNISKPIWPACLDMIKDMLYPIVEDARDENKIILRLVRGCLELKSSCTEDACSPDDILRKMHESMDKKEFVHAIQARYKAAIIDEFQDTDPLQWNIFQKCFLDNSDSKTICYLVGDPKQSIYAFRRADIYTYLHAGDVLGRENRYFLDTNFRSSAKLIGALNALFCEKPWISLPSLQSFLHVERVKSAPHKQEGFNKPLRFFIASSSPGRSKAWPTPTIELEAFFPYIAKEIAMLCKDCKFLFSDMAILVRDRYQGVRIGSYLKSHGIKVQFKRSDSLVNRDAWNSLKAVLYFFMDPYEPSILPKLLMTPLFGLTAVQVANKDERLESELLRELQQLKVVLEEHSFAAFFHELLNEKRSEEILARDAGIEFYRELMQLFELILENKSLSWRSSAHAILSYLSELELEENSDGLKILQESENAVQLITLHGSKGLEFPVVFALGLINRTMHDEEAVFQNDKLVAAKKGSFSYQKYMKEVDAEKERQLYVALTRAKELLYVPVLINEDQKQVADGFASPMELFLNAHFGAVTKNSLKQFLEGMHPEISCEMIENKIEIYVQASEEIPLLVEPKVLAISKEKLGIYSFSSLHSSCTPGSSNKVIMGKHEKMVPGGMLTGTIIHDILENKVGICSKEEILSYILGTDLEGYEDSIALMINHTVSVHLPSGFALKDIPDNKKLVEMEFLIPWDKEVVIEEITQESGFLMGFIDLIIEQGGKYYIIDWKTNVLNSYAQENLKSAMNECGYLLQANIYTAALKKYLKKVDKRPFKECFGGVYYLFLRGISEDPYNLSGIYQI
ncbi:MAG: UvrD-helicase domain-containing protein [Chlamydiales bacterium]|nr:UvrD-helicase domain-containing protein [Chlamydiales bacterium]